MEEASRTEAGKNFSGVWRVAMIQLRKERKEEIRTRRERSRGSEDDEPEVEGKDVRAEPRNRLGAEVGSDCQ